MSVQKQGPFSEHFVNCVSFFYDLLAYEPANCTLASEHLWKELKQ
jgi:hypothetical protein